MVEQIVGTIKAVSTKFNGGILLNERGEKEWFNGTPETAEIVRRLQKGERITLNVDKSKTGKTVIVYVTKDNGTNTFSDTNSTIKVTQETIKSDIKLNSDEKLVVLRVEAEPIELKLRVCKEITDRVFGKDENYKPKMEEICISSFIEFNKMLNAKRIEL